MTLRRLVPGLVAFILIGPVIAGTLATFAPAFGYFPALGGHHLSLSPFRTLLQMPGLSTSVLLSAAAGLITTAVALGMVTLFMAAAAGTPLMARIQHLVSPLLAIPHAAAAFGFAFLIAPSGLLLRLVSPKITGFTRPPDWLIVNDPLGLSMMAALVIKEIPFLFLMALAALPQLPVHRTRMMMASLGYGRIAGFVLALGAPFYTQMRLASFAVLAYAASVVDVAVILGPGLPAPLAVRVTGWMADPDLGMRFVASAGAVLQLGVIVACIVIWLGLEAIVRASIRRLGQGGRRLQTDRWLQVMVRAALSLSALLVFASIASLALWSVAGLWPFSDALPSNWTIRTWSRVLPQIGGPMATTVMTALLSSLIALLLTIALLWSISLGGRRLSLRLRALLFVPLILPQLSFVFGLQILGIGLRLEPSLTGLVLVHLIFVLPYVVLSLSAPWAAFDRRLEMIAQGLGTSPVRILLTLRLPILLRPCLTALAVGFAVSIGLYLPTLLIGAGRLTTITTEAVALSAGGDRRIIGVYALLQALLPFAGFAIASVVPQLLFRRRRAMRP